MKYRLLPEAFTDIESIGDYLTLYRVHGDAIDLLRVLHGRRQIDADDISA